MGRARLASCTLLALFLTSCGGADDPPSTDATTTPPPPSDRTTPSDQPNEQVTVGERTAIRTEVFGGPDWLASDGEWVYVKRDSAGVDRLDPDTGEVVDSVEIGGPVCQGLGTGYGSVWACSEAGLVRIDFDSGDLEEIEIDKAPEQGQLATGLRRVWVLVGDGSTLVGIDPTTNEAGPPLTLGVPGAELAFGSGRVWVVSALTDSIVEVDGTGTRILNTITGIDDPWTISATDSAVWVGALDEMVRIDPVTSEIVARVPGGTGRYGSVDASDREVWVRSADRFLELIDPSVNAVVEEVPYPDVESGGDVLVAHGAVWASAFDDSAVIRVSLR